jgi:Tfp pilus assembly protein PilO
MTNGDEIWRQRLWVWLPALVFFLLNAGAFTVYRLGYAGDVRTLERELETSHEELAPLRAARAELEQRIARARTSREQVAALYAERFATRSQRLTGITAEVKQLAGRAGLVPRAFSYPEEEIEDFGLVKRSFIFTVEGSYAELRRFISLLEQSRSFLTLEDATLSGQRDQEQELQISLTLSTLFAKESESTALAADGRTAPGAATPPGAASGPAAPGAAASRSAAVEPPGGPS